LADWRKIGSQSRRIKDIALAFASIARRKARLA